MSELNKPDEKNGEVKKSTSLLASIIKASAERTGNTIQQATVAQSQQNAEKTVILSKKIPREPISVATIMKMLGSLLAVSIIFFGSFLAYVAFNPAEAVFFVNTFNIDPKDIQSLLKKLINVTFGFMMVIISIVWIVTLFRAFWVPKDLKRKRLLSWLLAGIVGIVLFGILAFWGYLFRVVSANEYDNPDGSILIYDHAGYLIEEYRDTSRINNTQNLIGPIDIFFDIRSNANLMARRNLYSVQGFEINFDGAVCNNGSSTVKGSNPSNEQSLICRFEEIKPYNITGTYTVKNREGTVLTVPIKIPSIEIRGLVTIKQQKNTRNQKIVTIDASSLRKLGTPQWIYEGSDKVVTESYITEPINLKPTRICFKIFNQSGCDRIFVLKDDDSKTVKGSIHVEKDAVDSRIFQFSLSGVTINPNQILDIEWLLDEKGVMCSRGEEKCNYTFAGYGRHKIKSTITVASGEKFSFETVVDVIEPLSLVRHIKIFNKDGLLLNTSETYDGSLRSFILKNSIIPPESLTFDAREVVSANPGYILDTVLWKVSDGRETRELRGLKVDIEFSQSLRYNIEAEIVFKKGVVGEDEMEEAVKEFAVVDVERKKLMPRLTVTRTSDYVPSLVTVDASQSESEEGEIKKFIFDFGEGRAAAEGDSIQEYQYITPGDKTIMLTIVSDNGERASVKKTIVLKDQIKTIDWNPSMSIGNPGVNVDFEAIGTNGQIEDYIWNFGDNTTVERGFQVSHSYALPGKYTIMLTIIYSDGTQKTMKKPYEVVRAEEQ